MTNIIVEALQAARRFHYHCNDSWYCCGKCEHQDHCDYDGDYLGSHNGESARKSGVCNCGADAVNEKIDQALKLLGYSTPDPAVVASLNVKFMPVPRCDECKHWDRDEDDQEKGQCLMMYEGAATKIWPEYRDNIFTNADFGCVQWEPK